MEGQVKSARSLLVLSFVLSLAACAGIDLISDSDEKIDQGVTELHKKTEKILTRFEESLDNPAKTYRAAEYAEIKEDLGVLITRAKSWDKNELTVRQLYTLGFALLRSPPIPPEELKLRRPSPENSLEGRHRNKDSMTREDLQDLRTILDTNFQAVLKLELAKKRVTQIK